MIRVDFKCGRKLKRAHVYPLGDIHLGAKEVDLPKFVGYLKWIEKTEHAFAILSGDLFENPTVGSVSEPWGTMSPEKAYDLAMKLLYPIRKKIIVAIAGNHERRSNKVVGTNELVHLCQMLGIPYDEAEAVVTISVGKEKYIGYVSHGSGGGRTVGGKANMVHRLREHAPYADFLVCGHVHQIVHFIDSWTDEKGKEHKRIFCTGGTMLKRPTYAAVMGFPSAWTGFNRIFLDGKKHDIHCSS